MELKMKYKSKIFVNLSINKKELKKIIKWTFNNFGQRKAAYFVDQLKGLGFQYATNSGISISLEDLRVPPVKTTLMQDAIAEITLTQSQVDNGEITEVERFQKIIYIWNKASETLKDRLLTFFKKKDPLNSVYIMAFSGARGNVSQVRQLVGMRGLMSDPNGQIIDQAISANFREGLSITDYIISSYGARKGIVDTAVKTADSGYLTRRLVEIAQSIIISELDCKTQRGLRIDSEKFKKSGNLLSLEDKLIDRILAFPIFSRKANESFGIRNQQITPILVKKIIHLNIKYIIIKSPLVCQSRRAVCQQCYGLNIASGNLVELGETVGLIAAQSIGEPGTQLTMRTFHTGGIFTSELARQAHSNCAGYIHFVPTYKFKPFRTHYGQDAFLSERESYLRIIDYSNRIIEVKIDARTVILVQNHTCIKEDAVLFEAAPSSNNRNLSQKEIKYLLARRAGEIILEKNGFPQSNINENFTKRGKKNYIFWVLASEVFTTPFGSNIKARKSERVFKDQSIAQSKVINTINGFVNISKDSINANTRVIKIYNSFAALNNFKIFIESSLSEIEKCKVYLSITRDISIDPKMLTKQNLVIGFLNNKNYKTLTGGKFYSFYYLKRKREEKFSRSIRQRGLTIFYVPQSTIQTVCKKKDFYFKEGSYIEKNTEIFPYYITNFSGFITYQGERLIKTVIIKPGQRYVVNDKIINFDQIIERIYFPGEYFLNICSIEYLCYLELIKDEKNYFFHFTPISRYEITQEKAISQSLFPHIQIKLGENTVSSRAGQEFQTDNPIQFISYPLILDYSLTLFNSEINFEINKITKSNSWAQGFLGTGQTLILDNLIPKEIKKKDLRIDLLVEEKQFVEAYTNIISINIVMPWTDFIYKIKRKINNKSSRLLLTTTNDYKAMFFEDFNHYYKKNSLIKVNTNFNNNLVLKESGLLKKVLGNFFLLQLAEPYLFSKAAIIRKLPGDFIKRQENLGQLVYERLKTGDIIQGLPKVDEILEVRKPKIEAMLATAQGLITHIQYHTHKTFIILKPSFESNIYQFDRFDRLIVKKFQYISIGQPLNEGRINPHTLLQVYFRYFLSLGSFSIYESAYRSIKKLQALILQSVQAIYLSQGVRIADKHVELIVREITRKVYIEYPGKTNFLPGDILDLEQVNYINNSLRNSNPVLYRPILLGITKSSLRMEGFFAAASFQETTRVLTQAAIQGKTDWLQGLKENAITGRLIPAGTGFYINQDITYNKAFLPLTSDKSKLSLRKHLQIKQKKLKKIIKFKYTN